jgi:hypothetical protein
MDLIGGSRLSAREKKMKGKGEGGKRVAASWAGLGCLPRVGPGGLLLLFFVLKSFSIFPFSVSFEKETSLFEKKMSNSVNF